MARVTPSSDLAEDARGAPAAPRYAYPEPLIPEDMEGMDRVLDVDGEAFLAWLAGEGPEPDGWRDG